MIEPNGVSSPPILLTGTHKQHHERLLTVIGLWSLMMLQYLNEGHIDEHVSQHTCDYLHETEHLYFKYASKDQGDDLPF